MDATPNNGRVVKKRGRNDASLVVDRLPPHSPEAEQGVLGCCVLAPTSCIEICMKQITDDGAFYDPSNQTIYRTILSLFQKREPVDLITIIQRLNEKQLLEQVGGITYLNSLDEIVPTPSHIGFYIKTVIDKWVLRRMVYACTDIVSKIYENKNGDIAPLLAQASTDMELVMAPIRQSALQEHWSLDRLAGYDVANDPNAVIGWHGDRATRYLCRGYSAWIIAQAGIGKSSLALQQGCLWALGKPFCGIMPARTGLRILIVQNENDEGDAAEAIQGVLDGISFTAEEIDILRKNVKLIRCRGLTGADFCRWLEREVVAFHADIVYVDPLLRYAGIDVSRQDQCTKFLNNELDPVLARTGVVMIGIHHTGKPKSKRETEGWTIYDFAYSGIGSSELVNWARAISIVTPEKGGHFHMMLAKRGSRAWATHPGSDGTELTTSIYLKHAQGRICWEQIHEPPADATENRRSGSAQPGGRPNKVKELACSNMHDFCSHCVPDGEKLIDSARRLESCLAKEKIDVSTATCKRVIAELVANGKLTKNDAGLYVKGPNA